MQVVHEAVGCSSEEEREESIDLQTLYQARAYITAGCCFAIGLKFAGSCEQEAYSCLVSLSLSLSLPPTHSAHTQLEKMLSLKEENDAVIGKHCIEQCLQTILLAIAMVCLSDSSSSVLYLALPCGLQVKSGSGDLDVMRLIRKLRVRVLSPEVTYGSHMATHMALGLLFLGSGRYPG